MSSRDGPGTIFSPVAEASGKGQFTHLHWMASSVPVTSLRASPSLQPKAKKHMLTLTTVFVPPGEGGDSGSEAERRGRWGNQLEVHSACSLIRLGLHSQEHPRQSPGATM